MECKGCGKCCYLTEPFFDVLLDNFDLEIIEKSLIERKDGGSGKGYDMKRKEGGACIALIDNICPIYKRRPQECRDFKEGSKRCLELLSSN